MRELSSGLDSVSDPDRDPKAASRQWLRWLPVMASSVLWGGRLLACRLVLLAALGLCKLVMLFSLWGRQLSLIARRLRLGQRYDRTLSHSLPFSSSIDSYFYFLEYD